MRPKKVIYWPNFVTRRRHNIVRVLKSGMRWADHVACTWEIWDIH